MTNSTLTRWSVDGQSLQTFAFNIVTLGGDREAPPPLRGSDIVVPYVPGTKYVARVPDARIITLGMWVVGANADGSIPTNVDLLRTYEANWRNLRRLLWQPRRQFTLTKRFWILESTLVAGGVNVAALPQLGLFRLYTASATASYAGGLNPQMNGPARATFTVDLRLSDPYFYGDEITIPFTTAPLGGLNVGPSRTVSILGDDRTVSIELDLVGPLSAARMTNTTDGVWVQYGTSVPVSETATVRVKNFSATQFPSGAPFKSSGFVQHAGDRFWLYLDPKSTLLDLSVQSGTGTAALRYRPVWL